MTKAEMEMLDTTLIGPAMLFLNQYCNFIIEEYYVLWMCLVSVDFCVEFNSNFVTLWCWPHRAGSSGV